MKRIATTVGLIAAIVCVPLAGLGGQGRESGGEWERSPAASRDRAEERDALVDGAIVSQGISDPAVVRAMRTVPRHRFVPEALARRAYDDTALPIGYGQTISQPYVVAYMTEALGPADGKRVLEIGTGSGYQAAVLAETGAEVYSIEIVEELGAQVKERLARLGYGAIRLKVADGYDGWAEAAPFTKIIVTAAVDHVPPALLRQLAVGGRLILPLGPPAGIQTLLLITKRADGSLERRSLLAVRFVPMTGRALE